MTDPSISKLESGETHSPFFSAELDNSLTLDELSLIEVPKTFRLTDFLLKWIDILYGPNPWSPKRSTSGKAD